MSAERLPLYLRKDEYHQSFNFDLLEAKWDAAEFAEIIERSVSAGEKVGAPSTWVLSNHDVMRHATRYGLPQDTNWRKWPMEGPAGDLDVALGQRRARAAGMITLALPGSTYVYQGEELGLPEVWDLPTDVLDDPTWERSGHTEKGRDGARVPLPWEAEGPSLGFGAAAPWLPQPPQFSDFAAAQQSEDEDSMLHLYRAAIAHRRKLFTPGLAFEIAPVLGEVLRFTHGSVTVLANMANRPIEFDAASILLASEKIDEKTLPVDACVWIIAEE